MELELKIFSSMARLTRRISLVKFLVFVGLVWLLLLAFFSTWSDTNSPRGNDDGEVKKAKKAKLKAEDVPIFDDFEDDFAEPEKRVEKMKIRASKRKFISTPVPKSLLDPPEISQEIADLHKLLNLTNPGHMGKPVVFPANLPFDIQEQINKSWEIYSINEFVSRLIPLYRELPDIRPDYCRSVKYSDNLPVTSVIMIFHNEPFTLIMRSVFAVFKRTPEELLGEIVLVDDCSDRGESIRPDRVIYSAPTNFRSTQTSTGRFHSKLPEDQACAVTDTSWADKSSDDWLCECRRSGVSFYGRSH